MKKNRNYACFRWGVLLVARKLCEKCSVTYIDTKQIQCSYCHKPFKTVSTQGTCPNVSLYLLQADMAGHTNLYFGVH